MTDGAGQVVARYAYAPHGERLGVSGAVDNPLTWQGGQGVIDEGNGLYYLRSRYYDSRTGRFISRDPLNSADPRQINPYQYALNNPLRFSDPFGLSPGFGLSPVATGALHAGAAELAVTGGLIGRAGEIGVLAHGSFVRAVQAHADDLVLRSPATFVDDVARMFAGSMDDFARFDDGVQGAAKYLAIAGVEANKVTPLFRAAVKLRNAGNALAAAGVAIDSAVTIYDGVCHGDSAGIVIYDTAVTVGVDAAVIYGGVALNPLILIADAVTLGGVSGSIKNAFTGAQGACDIFLTDRFSSADAVALKRRMTRVPVTSFFWSRGEALAEALDDLGAIDWLAARLF